MKNQFKNQPEERFNEPGKVPVPNHQNKSCRAPQTTDEEILCGLFAEVLGVDSVGTEDNFFTLGGQSLSAVQLMFQVQRSFDIEVPIRLLFDAPTVAELGARLKEFAGAAQMPGIERSRHTGPLLLSCAQQRLWFLQRLMPDDTSYNETDSFRLRGVLNREALQCSLTEIVRRHEILRTYIEEVEGCATQVVEAPGSLELSVVESASETAPEEQWRWWVRQCATTPFDLRRTPMLRGLLLQLNEEEHLLVLTLHHIATDAWSMEILHRELSALYGAYSRGEESPLTELPIQYSDYASWQRNCLREGLLETGLAYWRKQLAGIVTLNLPTDHVRSPVQSHLGAREPVVLARGLVESVKRLNQSAGTTLFMTLLAGFQILLQRYTGQEDLVVGSPIAGRTREETGGLVGFFVNTLPLRGDMSGDPTVAQLLERVRRTALDAYTHQLVPFEKLAEELQPERRLNRNPIFQVMFAMQNAPTSELKLFGLQVSSVEVNIETAKFDLTLEVTEDGNGAVTGMLEYDIQLYEAATIRRMVEHWRTLLKAMVLNSERRVSSLPLLSEGEEEQLRGWSGSWAEASSKTVVELFEEQVEERGEQVAVEGEGRDVTYGELNAGGNRLAEYLRGMGVGREDRVGICLERSSELIVAMMGVVKAGGVYVPLDPEFPGERMRVLLEDAEVGVILSRRQFAEQLRGCGGARVVWLEEEAEAIRGCSAANRRVEVSGKSLAYLMYTSGSTGKPKGIGATQEGIVRLVRETNYMKFGPELRIVQVSNIAFDASTFEIWGALLNGGRLNIVSRSEFMDPGVFARLLKERKVTSMFLTTALFNECVRAEPGMFVGMRHVLFGGEMADEESIGKVMRAGGPEELIHVYGPTETVTFASYAVLEEVGKERGVPIGRPLSNTKMYVLDGQLRQVPVGVTGEIYIGGGGVGRGYWRRPDQTAERFVADPYSGKSGARMYQTGDLGRWSGKGEVEIQGRVDDQVKIRGFRIEPGEIEAVLRRQEGVQDAVVMAQKRDGEGKELVAYVVAVPGSPLDAGVLRARLQTELPAYMVPVGWLMLDRLPLNSSGKLDRLALPPVKRVRERGYTPPATPKEILLAGIWRAVLGAEQVGIDDNFFSLGGDSILSIQIVARAQQVGLHLTARQFFQNQTIAQLAASASQGKGIRAEQGRISGPVEMTPIQRWFFEHLVVEPSHFNQAMLFKLRRPVDHSALRQAVCHCLQQHDALRMRYLKQDSCWSQVNLIEESDRVFIVEDVSGFEADKQSVEIEQRAVKWQQTLDLQHGPMVRFILFDAGLIREARLLIIIHHLVVDGVSWRILLEDLQRSYDQAASNQEIKLGPKTTSYKQWAEHLCEYANSAELNSEQAYWIERTSLEPSDSGNQDDSGTDGVGEACAVVVKLDTEQTHALLRDVPAVYHTQINDVLITALAVALSRWRRKRRVRLNLEGHGREELFSDVDVSRTIGWFTTVFPVVLEVPANGTPGDALKAIKEQLRSIPRTGIGYGVLRYLGRDKTLSRHLAVPAEVCFNYLGQLDGLWSEESMFGPATEDSGPALSGRNRRSHAIEIDGSVTGGQLQMTWHYNKKRHAFATVHRVATDFVNSLIELIHHCQLPQSGGHTPSDFPLANLDSHTLALILQRAGQGTKH
jgi:amino acid adenylation domain-containing protein/non-ribosomal peptide synthase protein (TIGR01720 family)